MYKFNDDEEIYCVTCSVLRVIKRKLKIDLEKEVIEKTIITDTNNSVTMRVYFKDYTITVNENGSFDIMSNETGEILYTTYKESRNDFIKRKETHDDKVSNIPFYDIVSKMISDKLFDEYKVNESIIIDINTVTYSFVAETMTYTYVGIIDTVNNYDIIICFANRK